ncbi:MAG TPA: glycerol kinase GlpK, partial [Longimicrobiales bacterium]|nr:glycerol kinase GlpK [Longimicrobiales bacterium]
CMVIARDGRILGRAYSEFTQHFPSPGRVEHDAAEIWEVTLRVAQEAMTAAGAVVGQGTAGTEAVEVSGIGITNQRETVVVWDRQTGEPVHRAIVWQDRRTTERCRALKEEGAEPLIRSRTGLVVDPYFSGTKLEWLLDNVEGLRPRAEAGELAAGTIDSWLIWKLTGGEVHATDPTNASRTMLYNIDTRDWDDELLELLNVPRAILPEVRASSGSFGETTPELFGRTIPVAGVAGDQQAALFGQGCWKPGLAKNTYGTGAFLLLHTGKERIESGSGLLTTIACDATGQPAYALEGAIFVAGAAVQWLRDGLGLFEDAAETAGMAASLDSNDGVYLVPAFVGLGAPHWQPDARGMIVGLTRGADARHLARAALESMAYSTADVLRAMERDSGVPARELAVDGGAAANDWMMQFQADILGLTVRRPQVLETTALGAAGLAGLATGVWADADEFLGSRPDPDRFSPAIEEAQRGPLLAGWKQALRAALHWAEGATEVAASGVGSDS